MIRFFTLATVQNPKPDLIAAKEIVGIVKGLVNCDAEKLVVG